jgi:acetamidase/formamidase
VGFVIDVQEMQRNMSRCNSPRAVLACVTFAITASTTAWPQVKPDVTLPSTPKTVVRGIIASDVPPVLRIRSGQTVRIDTVSHQGLQKNPIEYFGADGIPESQVLPDAVAIYKGVPAASGFGGHVLTGPIYIERAEPGDLLEVRVRQLENRVPYGVNAAGKSGVLPGLLPDNDPKTIKLDLARHVAQFSKDVEVPLVPFLGIMAVAGPPEQPRISSRPPGAYGGNMDFKHLTQGATLYLPVFNKGALFYTGDSHAVQGDGEVDGTALEVSLTATLQFIVHKGGGKDMPFPRAEDAANYYVLGMDKDLNLALKNAVSQAVQFLQGKGLSVRDAYALSSIGVDFGIAEAVDENLTVYGRIPKKLFKAHTPYWAAQ